MVSDGLNPVFMPKIDVTTLRRFSWTRRVPADGLNEIFVFIVEASRICYELDVAFEHGHGIKHLHLFALFPFDVLFWVGKPRTHGSRCGNGETNTRFEMAPVASRCTIEGIVGHSNGSVVDADLGVFVVVGNTCFLTEFKLGFASVENGST